VDSAATAAAGTTVGLTRLRQDYCLLRQQEPLIPEERAMARKTIFVSDLSGRKLATTVMP
jgi:hypothetical protein